MPEGQVGRPDDQPIQPETDDDLPRAVTVRLTVHRRDRRRIETVRDVRGQPGQRRRTTDEHRQVGAGIADDRPNWLLLGLVVVLLAASAFFVAAEFALIAARRTVIEPMAVNSARARSTLKAMENVSLMMACAQLGITLCGVLLGALGEPAVAALLEPVFALARRAGGLAAPGVAGDRAAAGGLRARGARRDGAEEHRHRRPRADRADAGAGAADDRNGDRPDHPDPEPAGQRCRPAHRPGTQGRGGLRVHPGGGRRPGRRVATGGPARRRGTPADHLGAGFRHHSRHLGDGARRRGGVRAAGRHRGRGRADLRPDRVLPLSRSSRRTAGSRATCTSGTWSTSPPTGGTNRSRPTGSGRCRPSSRTTDLRTALDRMRRIGAHLAEVAVAATTEQAGGNGVAVEPQVADTDTEPPRPPRCAASSCWRTSSRRSSGRSGTPPGDPRGRPSGARKRGRLTDVPAWIPRRPGC